MLQGSLSVLLNTQKITFGFWDPKKLTTHIFPWTELSLRIFLFILQIPICFLYQFLENPKKDIKLAVNRKRERDANVILCLT